MWLKVVPVSGLDLQYSGRRGDRHLDRAKWKDLPTTMVSTTLDVASLAHSVTVTMVRWNLVIFILRARLPFQNKRKKTVIERV